MCIQPCEQNSRKTTFNSHRKRVNDKRWLILYTIPKVNTLLGIRERFKDFITESDIPVISFDEIDDKGPRRKLES